MQPQFLYWEDTRAPSEVILANHLVDKLSALNQLNDKEISSPLATPNKQVLTITINGIPMDPKEWTGFTFPGKVVNYFPPGIQDGKSPEFYIQRLKKCNLSSIVAQIDEIVENNGGKVVLVTHSFGNYIAVMYTHFNPKKVVGFVEFGGIPITIYTGLKSIIIQSPFFNRGLDFYLSHVEEVFAPYVQTMKSFNINLMRSPYNLIAFLLIISEYVVQNVFAWKRNLPKSLLKLIVVGRNDRVFEPYLLNQMVVHFALGEGVVSEETSLELWRRYTAVCGQSSEPRRNIQERFVYSLNSGHGPHLTKKAQAQKIMDLYLAIVLMDTPASSSL